jgi:predicted dehydrogenase
MVGVLVVGAGSIGSRHARNLRALGAAVDVAEPVAARAAALAGEVGGRVVPLEALGSTEHAAVVLATPTLLHHQQGIAALHGPGVVMVEKPLAVDVKQAEELVEAGGGRLMVGFNLRLHRPVQELMAVVHGGRIGRVLAARLWFGSYLPSWRPAVDYRTTYSARADLAGGVLLDAVHELDLALWLTGDEPEVVAATVGRLGDLDIDVEDTVRALLRTEAGVPVTVELDYLSRRYRRGIEVIGELGNARLDWARGSIEIEDAEGVEVHEAATPVALSYEVQAARLLAFATEGQPPPVDGPTGLASVRLAEAIRRAGVVDA